MRGVLKSHLVACIADHSAFLWERLEGMPRYVPRRFDVVLLKKFQQSPDADCAGEKT